jgi:protein required for attachment to host cells
MKMNETFIIVADAKRARFFAVERSDAPRNRVKLVERVTLVNPDVEGVRRGGAGRVKTERVSNRQAGDVHPIEGRRQQHRIELERRFGREITQQASKLSRTWKGGTIVLIAEPRLLGLTRHYMRDALDPAVELKELARNYAQLTPSELQEHLDLKRLAPARRGIQ